MFSKIPSTQQKLSFLSIYRFSQIFPSLLLYVCLKTIKLKIPFFAPLLFESREIFNFIGYTWLFSSEMIKRKMSAHVAKVEVMKGGFLIFGLSRCLKIFVSVWIRKNHKIHISNFLLRQADFKKKLKQNQEGEKNRCKILKFFLILFHLFSHS